MRIPKTDSELNWQRVYPPEDWWVWDTVFGLFRGFLFENRPRKTGTEQVVLSFFFVPSTFSCKSLPILMSSMSFKRVVQQSPIVTCTEPTLQLAHVHPRKDSFFFGTPSHGGWGGWVLRTDDDFRISIGWFFGGCFFFPLGNVQWHLMSRMEKAPWQLHRFAMLLG